MSPFGPIDWPNSSFSLFTSRHNPLTIKFEFARKSTPTEFIAVDPAPSSVVGSTPSATVSPFSSAAFGSVSSDAPLLSSAPDASSPPLPGPIPSSEHIAPPPAATTPPPHSTPSHPLPPSYPQSNHPPAISTDFADELTAIPTSAVVNSASSPSPVAVPATSSPIAKPDAPSSSISEPPQPLRRSALERQPSVLLKNFVCSQVTSASQNKSYPSPGSRKGTRQLCILNCRLSRQIKVRLSLHCRLVRLQLVFVGCTRSSIVLMVRLNVTKCVWLPKVSLN